MPAYNEEKRIGKTLDVYSAYFENLRKKRILDYEILVIINAATDNTKKIVKKAKKKNPRIFYLDLVQGGKGYAVIEGFKIALNKKNDLIGFVDADMATSPSSFKELIDNIGEHDAIIASRYIKGARVIPPNTFRRLIVSRIFNNLVRAFFLMPYKDTQCGAKLFKKKALQNTIKSLTLSHWAFDVDLIYNLRKEGFKIIEYPTVWVDKKYSKINFFKAGPLMFLAILRLRLINSPFKGLISLYDRIPDKLKIHRRFR